MTKVTADQYIKSNNILFLALLGGQMFFGFLIVFLEPTFDISLETAVKELLLIMLSIFAIAAFLASHLLFKMRINAIRKIADLPRKLRYYRSAIIIRFALLEMAFFMSLIAYLLLSEILFLVLAGLVLLWFVMQRPTVQKISTDLNLTHEEPNFFQ